MHFVEIQLLQFYAIRPKLYGNCAFLKKFYTRELDKNAVFFAVTVNNVQKCKDNNSARILVFKCTSVSGKAYFILIYFIRVPHAVPFLIFSFSGEQFHIPKSSNLDFVYGGSHRPIALNLLKYAIFIHTAHMPCISKISPVWCF